MGTQLFLLCQGARETSAVFRVSKRDRVDNGLEV
jgi:hypothetical protein